MTDELGSLVELVSSASVVLYDFDGPLCDVFAGLPARTVARELEKLAGSEFATDDPFEVLRQSAGTGELNAVEDALVQAELAAVECSEMTPGGIESMRSALAAGMRVGVVSNNSAWAVERVIEQAGLSDRVWPVVGRVYRTPARMKPDPWPLASALRALAVQADAVIFVGDSATDIEAAQFAAMPCVAYANKPGKRERFERAGATAVIDSMWELDAAIADAATRQNGLQGG